MTDSDRCPVHPSVSLVDAPEDDVGRICPRCEAERHRRPRVAADGGHELVPSIEAGAEDGGGGDDTDTPRIDDAVATVTRTEYVDTAATVEVSGGTESDGEGYFQVVTLRVCADEVTLDVELARPAAAALRAELDDALLEAEELAATHR